MIFFRKKTESHMHFRRHFFRRCDTIRSERSAFYDFTKTQIFSFSVYSPADSGSASRTVLFQQHAGLPASLSTQSNTPWNLILVNNEHALPKGYSPELMTLSNGVQVDSRIYPDLQSMFDDMRTEGVYPVVGEGYRSEQQQQEMMQEKIDAYLAEGYSERKARKEAEKWVAKPNYSEHQLGLALDINADKSRCDNDTVYQWLAQNAYRYGFIRRYPEGKEDITGIDYEPWHYRYVGKEAAQEIQSENVCLEEYLEKT